jgi:hypothetical protein
LPPQSLAPHHPAQTAAALAAADAATLADPDAANADDDAGHNIDAAAVDAVDADEEVVAITAGAEPGRGVRNRSRMGPPRVEGECEGERRTTTAEQTRSSDSAHWMRVRFNY